MWKERTWDGKSIRDQKRSKWSWKAHPKGPPRRHTAGIVGTGTAGSSSRVTACSLALSRFAPKGARIFVFHFTAKFCQPSRPLMRQNAPAAQAFPDRRTGPPPTAMRPHRLKYIPNIWIMLHVLPLYRMRRSCPDSRRPGRAEARSAGSCYRGCCGSPGVGGPPGACSSGFDAAP